MLLKNLLIGSIEEQTSLPPLGAHQGLAQLDNISGER